MAKGTRIAFDQPKLAFVGGWAKGLFFRSNYPPDLAVVRIQTKKLAIVPMCEPEFIFLQCQSTGRPVRAIELAYLFVSFKGP
jgi:hypothetical protein